MDWHPGNVPEGTPGHSARSARLQRLNYSYDILCDQERRKHYDAACSAGILDGDTSSCSNGNYLRPPYAPPPVFMSNASSPSTFSSTTSHDGIPQTSQGHSGPNYYPPPPPQRLHPYPRGAGAPVPQYPQPADTTHKPTSKRSLFGSMAKELFSSLREPTSPPGGMGRPGQWHPTQVTSSVSPSQWHPQTAPPISPSQWHPRTASPVSPSQWQPQNASPFYPSAGQSQATAALPQIIVNKVPLDQTSLSLLTSRGIAVAPGRYWYDQQCGGWGLEGGPCLGIIAPHLPLGGPLQPDASGPSITRIFINGRQIHAVDVRGLQAMGVTPIPACWWLQANGSYGLQGNPIPLGNLHMQALGARQSGSGGAHSWSTGHSFGGSDGQGFSYVGGDGWSVSWG